MTDPNPSGATTVARTLPLSRLPHIIASYAYVWWWVLRENAKSRYGRYLDHGTKALLTLYLLLLLLEVGLEISGHSVAATGSIALQLVFFVLIAIAVMFKVEEWREGRQQVYFAGAAAEIVSTMGRIQPGNRDDEVITRLLAIFQKNFEAQGAINANLSLPDDGDQLKVRYVYPEGAPYDDKLALPKGVGGSGNCYAERRLVYIPSKHYRHGIMEIIDSPTLEAAEGGQARSVEARYQLVPDCYVPCTVEPFETILSVPLLAYEDRKSVV